MRGRKKTLKIHHEPDTAVPEAPASLSNAAREHWTRLAPLLVAEGLLAPLQVDLLARYVTALATIDEADAMLAAQGKIGLSATLQPEINKWWNIRRDAVAEQRESGILLGIPLAAKQKIKPAKADKPASAKKWEGLIANG